MIRKEDEEKEVRCLGCVGDIEWRRESVCRSTGKGCSGK